MKRSRARRIADRLESEFRLTQRHLPWRAKYDPYQVWVSEIMLQQTRMEVVLDYFPRFLIRFPDVHALARASEEEVVAAWSGLGYYRRARMLHRGAVVVAAKFGGRLPSDLVSLQAIPGIGRYTSGAIASIAFDRPAAIVDGNVSRLISRLEAIAERPRSAGGLRRLWSAAKVLVSEAASPRVLNQALMEHGSLVCRPRRPHCEQCPLARDCAAHLAGAVERFPISVPKGDTVRMEIPLYLIVDRGGRVLMRRGSGSLLDGMYHLPHGKGPLMKPLSRSRIRTRGPVARFSHTITYRRIHFDLVGATLVGRRAPEDYVWIDGGRLASLPHPSYVRKALLLAERVWFRHDEFST